MHYLLFIYFLYYCMNSKLLLTFLFLLMMFSSPVLYSQNSETSSNDLKFTLLSLGSGSTRITYEKAFNPMNSAEFTLGIIGMGWDIMNGVNPQGLLCKLAYKWRLIPQKGADSWLAGFYLKPELVLASYDYETKSGEGGGLSRDVTHQYALMAECGYQLVLNWFVFDIYTGLGPTVGTGNADNYYHSFMRFPDDGPLAYTAGFRLGVAF